jgi:hypothetical protein
MLAEELVRDVALRLGAEGIAVMPVKGAFLQRWLYDDPSERPLTDVDMLVAPGGLELAREILIRAGYRETGRPSVGAIELSNPFLLTLDLHPHLFHPTRYRLSTEGLFDRSIADEALFDVTVRIPSPLDAYAHAIGKFGSDHLTAAAVFQLEEIARIGNRLAESESDIAAHLSRCGMRRVARYVLQLVCEATNDELSRTVLQTLPADPLGRGIAALSRTALDRLPASSRLGAIFAHLLNDTLPRGLRSGLSAMRGTRSTCLTS